MLSNDVRKSPDTKMKWVDGLFNESISTAEVFLVELYAEVIWY
jgi:hypothetical protein